MTIDDKEIARLRALWPPDSQFGAEDVNRLLDEVERLRAEVAAWRAGNPSDDLWRVRMEQAAARAEKAEAACAAMRLALVPCSLGLRGCVAQHSLSDDRRNCVYIGGRLESALATDAGTGWVSPEVAEQMAAALKRREHANSCPRLLWPTTGGACTCGRDAALAAYEKTKG